MPKKSHLRWDGDLGLGSLSGLLSLALLLVNLLGVTVEEQIGHNVPLAVPGEGATDAEHLELTANIRH